MEKSHIKTIERNIRNKGRCRCFGGLYLLNIHKMDNTKQVKRQEITEIAKRLSDEEKQKIKNEFTAQSVEGLPYSEGNIDLLYLQEGLPGTY